MPATGTLSSFDTSAGLILLAFRCELPEIELGNGQHPEIGRSRAMRSFISKPCEWSIKAIELYGCLAYNYTLLQSVDKVSCVPHLFSGEIISAFSWYCECKHKWECSEPYA